MRIILTGATGMVGEGVLLECLQRPEIEHILILGRRPSGIYHPKVEEIVHSNLSDIIKYHEIFADYDACFYCIGTTAVGKSELDYIATTYALTMSIATVLSAVNLAMTFCYISAWGTDSTVKGKYMWARVKGRTENELMKLPFKNVFHFRPAFLLPTRGQKYVQKYYKYIQWTYPLGRKLLPRYYSTISELGKAMIYASIHGFNRNIIEVPDITFLSKKLP